MYDYNTMSVVKYMLRSEGCVFLDVGANRGAYTFVASEVETALVVPIEPYPEAFRALEENVELNARKKVLLLEVARGDRDGDGC